MTVDAGGTQPQVSNIIGDLFGGFTPTPSKGTTGGNVYMGSIYSGGRVSDQYQNSDEFAYNTWEAINNNPQAWDQLAQMYNAANGYALNHKVKPQTLKAFFNSAVNEAQKQYDKGAKVTVTDVINSWMPPGGTTMQAQPKAPAGAYTGPTSSVTQTNQTDAHAILNDALSRYLGRDATDAELAAFKADLNKQEAANPVVNTPNVAAHSTTQTGGVNQQELAVEYAKSRPEYAETTADTTLMGWFMNALQGGN